MRIPTDPLRFKQLCWPDVLFYDKQWDSIHSVEDCPETYIVAGNKLGKDFVAAFIVLWFFLTRDPVRIVTTSVADEHLIVLWDEVARYLQTSRYPLTEDRGGPLRVLHRNIRKVYTSGPRQGELVPISYVLRQVSEKGEKMAGHHAEHALLMGDEASGLDDVVYKMGQGWMHRAYFFGNANSSNNFYQKAVEGGSLEDGVGGYDRRIIRILGEDSPNVKLGLRQVELGLEPTDEKVVEGNLLSYKEYSYRRRTWDLERQTIGLDAQFYAGPEMRLFPKEWLDRANRLADTRNGIGRVWMGVDPAMGGDKSAWALIDELGLFKLVSMKTPNTTDVPTTTVALMREHNIASQDVCIDLGGGGKQHMDRLKVDGYPIRGIAFGEAVVPTIRRMRTTKPFVERETVHDEKYIYVNRRSQLYGEMSIILDPMETGAALKLPAGTHAGFILPPNYNSILRHQLEPIPKTWDRGGEGKLRLLPKDNTEDPDDPRTLTKLIGHSPDEADALALAVHARLHKAKRTTAGAW